MSCFLTEETNGTNKNCAIRSGRVALVPLKIESVLVSGGKALLIQMRILGKGQDLRNHNTVFLFKLNSRHACMGHIKSVGKHRLRNVHDLAEDHPTHASLKKHNTFFIIPLRNTAAALRIVLIPCFPAKHPFSLGPAEYRVPIAVSEKVDGYAIPSRTPDFSELSTALPYFLSLICACKCMLSTAREVAIFSY